MPYCVRSKASYVHNEAAQGSKRADRALDNQAEAGHLPYVPDKLQALRLSALQLGVAVSCKLVADFVIQVAVIETAQRRRCRVHAASPPN